MWRRVWLVAAWVFVGSGCGGPQYGEVEGRVTLGGQPLPNLEIAFLPDPEKGTTGPRASAFTDQDGRFRLRTDKDGRPGALVGFHRVVLFDTRTVAGARTAARPPSPSRIPLEYTREWRTPLRNVEVKTGRQELNFDIPSARAPGH